MVDACRNQYQPNMRREEKQIKLCVGRALSPAAVHTLRERDKHARAFERPMSGGVMCSSQHSSPNDIPSEAKEIQQFMHGDTSLLHKIQPTIHGPPK